MGTTALRREKSATARTAAYAAGSLGTGVFSTVPTVLLLYFSTEILHIRPEHAAALVFIPKAWSILWDPFVGAWSDATRSKWGRRIPFLVAGALGVGLSFVALFSPPDLGYAGTVAWTAAAYFLLATVYSLFAVPYVALPAEIASSRPMRGQLVAWRMVVGMAGVLTGASLAPLLVSAVGGGRHGYHVMSLIVAAACLAAMLMPIFAARGPVSLTQQAAPTGFGRQLRQALAARGFLSLAGSYLLQISAVGVLLSALPYLVTHSLGRNEGDIGIAMAALLGGSIVTPPLWGSLGNRYGERAVLMAAIGAFAVVSGGIAAAVSIQVSWPWMLAVLTLAGFAFAGLQVLPFTMLAHLAHAERMRVGASAEATITGLWTATEKLGLAIGPAVTAMSLALLGTAGLPKAVAVAPLMLLFCSALSLRFGRAVS